jgi:hypothetical protein
MYKKKKKKALIFRRICDLFTGFWWSKSIYGVRKNGAVLWTGMWSLHAMSNSRDVPQTVKFERTLLLIKQFHLFCHMFNLLKPTGYGMHQQVEYFNNCTLCPHCIYVFCSCLRTNSDLCHLH